MHARKLDASHGVVWLLAGLALYRRNPPLLTVLSFSYLLLVLLINLVPLVGPFLLPMALPALTAMLGNGCRSIEQRKLFASADLMRGMQERRVDMIRLGGLHLLGSSLLVIVSLMLGTDLTLDPEMSQERALDLLKDLSIMIALSSPLLMAFWFAPLLTLWDGVPATKAVFFSFVASWRNWRAFAAYALAVLVVGMFLPALILLVAGSLSGLLAQALAVALRMLLVFILAPVLVASVYLSYRDVFRSVPAEPAASVDVVV